METPVIPDKLTCTYKVVDECEIRTDVYRAADSGPRPVVVWIHGGALILGHREDLAPWQRDLYLAAGYHVVSLDYRLAPESKLPAIIEDLRDGLRWVRESGPRLFAADARRLAVVGHSAGAYLALMSGFCVDPRPKALVAFYGCADAAADWHLRHDPSYWQQPPVSDEEAWASVGRTPLSCTREGEKRIRFYLYCRQRGLWFIHVAGCSPGAQPQALTPFSPLRNISADYPPTLLVHGEQDADVPCQESVMMSEALTRAGVENELIVVPGAAHVFDAEENEVTTGVMRRVLAFLAAHV